MHSNVTPQPVQRKRIALVEQVVESLTQQIVAGKWASGQFLPPEAELAQMFSVSRTVIREAMRLLSARGLVQVSHGKRPCVKAPNTDATMDSLQMLLQRGAVQLKDLAEVRRPLEADIAALAAERITDEQVEALEQAIDAQQNAAKLEDQVAADLRFHNLLAEATGNMIFKVLIGTVTELLIESRRRTITKVGVERAIAHHRKILDAVKRRDSNGARSAMIEHVNASESDLGIHCE